MDRYNKSETLREGWVLDKVDKNECRLNILINGKIETILLRLKGGDYEHLCDMISTLVNWDTWTLTFDGKEVDSCYTPISELYGKKVEFKFDINNSNNWAIRRKEIPNIYMFTIQVSTDSDKKYSFEQEYDTVIGLSLAKIIKDNPNYYFIFYIDGKILKHFEYYIQNVYPKRISCNAIDLRDYYA